MTGTEFTVGDDGVFFGPAWRGWDSYHKFAQSVKSDLRYVRSKPSNDFLDEVLASCARRKLVIRKDSIFWRARLGCDSVEVEQTDGEVTAVYEQDRPYGAQGMKPIPNWQSEGRANPRGIPCLYVATTRDTALAEIRPWIGAFSSVAQLKVVRDLNVIDCSKHHEKNAFIKVFGDKTLSREDGIWIAIDRAFATPVGKDVESREYVATQILAELFKSASFDGIVYKSLLSEDGYNVALFNLNDADVINCALFTAKSIMFEFDDQHMQYFVGPSK